MKGDIILEVVKLLSKKGVGKTFRYTYLQKTGGKAAYLYWLCCLLCRAGYIKRISGGGIYQITENMPKDLGSSRSLLKIAYNQDNHGVKV